MPRATYTLEMELSAGSWTGVTGDWHTATPLVIERGIEPGERLAGVGRMTFALYNPDGRYTPGHQNAKPGFEVGVAVRLRASYGGQTDTLFYGRLAEIIPRGERGEPVARIVCRDEMAAVYTARLETFPLLLDARPKDVVTRLVRRAFTPPGLAGYWQLGRSQASELGQNTRLPDDDTGTDYDEGQSVFPWVGDTWHAPPGEVAGQGIAVARALREVCASEGGTFYLAADGTPVFADRHARPRHITPDATLSGSLAGLRVERSEGRVANRIEITTHPREASSTVEVLWSLNHTLRLEEGVPRTLVCRYVDPDQKAIQVGAWEVVPPAEGTDYAATDQPDGTGQDVTDYLTVEAEAGASSARLTLTSDWRGPGRNVAYVHLLRVRGKPLRTYQPVTVVAEDEASQAAHGRRLLHLDMPLQDDAAVAGDLARALLANRKDPRDWLTVRVEATASATLLTHGLARDVGDRLRVSDDDLGLNGVESFIEKVRHEIGRGGASH
ncbi:MAG TPA: hypothetical protein ENI95_09085, partial [Chloroflexi bacterium]|nr:hypothetical protein [Chloroflexota bacterium]